MLTKLQLFMLFNCYCLVSVIVSIPNDIPVVVLIHISPYILYRLSGIHIVAVNKKNISTELDLTKTRLQTLCPGNLSVIRTVKYFP